MSSIGLKKHRAPDLPPVPPVDEIIVRIEHELTKVRGLALVLADRAKEAESAANRET